MPKQVNINGVGLVNFPDSMTPEQITNAIETDILPKAQSAKAPQQEATTPNTIGRQIGLTARAGIEGIADTIGLFSDPIAGLVNEAGGNLSSASDVGSYVADSIGLPSPENARERNVNTAAKFAVGTGGVAKLAQSGARNVMGAGKRFLESLTARSGSQIASGASAGYTSSAIKENGGGAGAQFAGAVIGGLAAPVAVGGIENIVQAGSRVIRNTFNPQALDNQINNAFSQAGINIGELPPSVRTQLKSDVQEALKTGDQLSPDALRRLADYRSTGATPMRSSLTLDPADVTRDQNLVKMSANSQDPAVQQLARVKNENNRILINNLNDMGAGGADDSVAAGGKLIESLGERDIAAKGVIDSLYNEARATGGRSAQLDPSAFTQRANDLLDESLLGGKLPSDVRNLLNKTATGEMPLTVDVAEQIKTRIGALQRASRDPAERLALGQVRQALEDTPLIEGQGQQAIDAFNKARKANRAYMSVVESTPALKAVRDGIEPDKFVSDFVTGSKATIKDLENLRRAVKSNPEALETVRSQMLSHLKNKAVGGAADEVAKVSQSNFNKTLKDIGEPKLSIFFTKDEIENLKRLGRVASYEQFQPAGSAVNNSNTAATLFVSLLERIADNALIRKIPLGGDFIADPAKSASVAIQSRKALKASGGLTKKLPKPKDEGKYPLSALLASGGALTAAD